jgi:hypothetical protein
LDKSLTLLGKPFNRLSLWCAAEEKAIKGDFGMKTSLATTLSVVGVLASGAGAFAVNSYVLDGSSNVSYAAPAEVTVVDAGIAEVAASAQDVAAAALDTPDEYPRSTVAKTPSSVPSTTTAPRLNSTAISQTSTYNVGESGRVTLEISNGELRVVSVSPNSGWTAKLPEYDDGEIEVEFYSGSLEVEFKARLVNGEINVFVESEDKSLDDRYERDDDDHDDEHDDDHDEDHGEREDD